MSIVKLNNKAVSNATAFGSISSLGSMTFIKKLTASGSSTLSFVDGTDGVVLDDTYKEYVFTFNNIECSFDGGQLSMLGSIDGGSNYNVVKTTTFFAALHSQNDDVSFAYNTGKDIAQGTGRAIISYGTGNGSDESVSGTLNLFNPSSTTFVKHFTSNFNSHHQSDYSINSYTGGYFNNTSAINAIRFDFDNGTMTTGDICLYGIA